MVHHKIKKVLIANRGEIAARVQRACRALGISSVIGVSEQDKNALFAREAEEIAVLGPASPAQSYLAVDKIIEAANKHGADAIHPGFGFLSENAEFAKRVTDAGLIFVGPESETIRIMGSKTMARERVTEFQVPVVPGSGSQSDAELVTRAADIGYPVLIKAVGGGGGRGMRVAQNEKSLRESLPLARGEALKNFANESVFIEKYVENPRHVEVQVFGDSHGNIIHLGTRDCSTQRRHQKLVEEAPAPDLDTKLRSDIQDAAVRAAKSVNYRNAGTVEFLVKDGAFYFLEMNTRIQVEHPVTEMVTGVDLVQLQLKVAMGEPLGIKQEEVKFNGHAIEFRICAEDADNNFMPTRGKITVFEKPSGGSDLRLESGFGAGDEISSYYDGMMAKVVVWGRDRSEAIRSSYKYLRELKLKGLKSNLDFHRWIVRSDRFRQGPLDIGYIEREFSAACLEELRVAEAPDRAHRTCEHGAEIKERFHYSSRKFGVDATIEVVHRGDGCFVAVPIRSDGRPASARNSRVSNGLSSALESVKQEVLENVSPENL